MQLGCKYEEGETEGNLGDPFLTLAQNRGARREETDEAAAVYVGKLINMAEASQAKAGRCLNSTQVKASVPERPTNTEGARQRHSGRVSRRCTHAHTYGVHM